MPIEWLAVGQAALNAGAGIAAKGALGKAAKTAAGLFQSGGPIDKELAGALAKAGEGFAANLTASYPDDRELSTLVEQLAEREDFQQALGSLPYVPFASIDINFVRQVFVERRGTEDAGEDFDGAWRAASKRFAQAAAKKEEVGRFVELQYRARSEQRDEVQLGTIEEISSFLRSIDERQARAEAPLDEQPILTAYRRSVYEEYRYADTSGLFQREKLAVGEAIGLEEIFVETLLGREAQRQSSPKEEGDEEAKSTGEKRSQKLDPLREPTEIQPIRAVLSRDRLTVILGSPGSGKSTLMRCLALSVCRPSDAPPPVLDGGLEPTVVPMLLPLKEYASALRDDPDLILESFLFQRFATRLPHLKDLLDSGRALLLFDGFDEVFDERHRLWVRDQVWRLASQFPAARIVLTSRPHGYASAPLPGPVALWKVQPFGEGEIRRFLHGWFRALAREGGEAGGQEPPEKRAEALAQEILSRERLKEMAENPLLSTLIVLVGRNRSGRLPDRRVVFFEAAAKTFAESWERAKHAPIQVGEEGYEFPEPEILLRALAEVAWRAHHELGSREIPGETLRQWLGAYLEREPEWSGARGRRAVKDFLRLVDQRTGLLVELGGGAYQVVHLSLHEWFVSYYLLDRLPSEKRLAVIRHYLHVPEWEEILRLTIAGAPQAEAAAMITVILDQPSHELEPQLRRDFRFALHCLEDQAPIGAELHKRIVSEVLPSLSNPDSDHIGSENLAPLGGAPEIRNSLLQALNSEDPRIRDHAAFALTQIDAFEDTSIQSKMFLHLEDISPGVRAAAVDFFDHFESVDESVLVAITARLADYNPEVRAIAASFFANRESADENMFLELLTSENSRERAAAIEFFVQLGDPTEEELEAIFARLYDDDSLVRVGATEFFFRVAAPTEIVRRAMLIGIEDSNSEVRDVALYCLYRMDHADEAITEVALRSLRENPLGARGPVLWFLAQYCTDNERVREAVFEMRVCDDPGVRRDAGSFFSGLCVSNPTIRAAIVEMLSNNDARVRDFAVASLALIGASNQEVRTSLLQRLSDVSTVVRARTLEFAIQQGLAIDTDDLLNILSEPRSDYWRETEISREIGRRSAGDLELRRSLFEKCSTIENFDLHGAIVALVTEEDCLRREANPLPF